MQDLIRLNQSSAALYGWGPADFGVPRFDDHLVEAIRTFQRDRILDETGIVDRATFRVMQEQRKIAEIAAEDEAVRRKKSQAGLGYGDDAEIAPFAGLRLHLPRAMQPVLCPPATGLVCDVRWAHCLPDPPPVGFAWVPTRSDLVQRVAADVRAFAARSPVIVLGVADRTIAEAQADTGPLLAALGVLRAAAGAALIALGVRIDPYRDRQRDGVLKAMRGQATILAPFVPADFGGMAPESYLIQMFQFGSMHLGVPTARSFPTFVLDTGVDPAKITRARIYLRNRQHRGHAYSWPLTADQQIAAFGPVPDQVVSIDPGPSRPARKS